jgi:hypothetical protein
MLHHHVLDADDQYRQQQSSPLKDAERHASTAVVIRSERLEGCKVLEK